jgi:hypothetical protein
LFKIPILPKAISSNLPACQTVAQLPSENSILKLP